jgi:hypothetical protein
MKNILPQSPVTAAGPEPGTVPKNRISILGVILTIILAIVLVTLGERILFDLNKTLNPLVEKVQQGTDYNSYGGGLTMERSALSNQIIYYQPQKSDQYLNYKILINASFIIPIFLLTFLLYYFFNVKKRGSNLRVVSYGYLIFSLWMVLHLVISLVQLAYREFPQMALYLILIFFAAIFTVLAVFIQKKVNQHHNQ